MENKHKICHLIANLGLGGAERMLLKLVSQIDQDRFESEIICMTGPGTIGDELKDLGVSVEYLGMRRGIPDPRGLASLVRMLRRSRPGLLQTWMYHADLIGGLAGKLAGRIPVVWNIRNSTLDKKFSKKSTILTVKACARLSKILCEKIVCCAESAAALHANLGYSSDKMITIPNGFDTNLFKPDDAQGVSVRKELDIPQGATVIGLIARFDPQKDHAGFIEATRRLIDGDGQIHFVLCGDGVSWENETLSQWVRSAGTGATTHLLGPRMDIARITACFDIGCSSSAYGEAFSNSIGEAMACGIPCVVTDVGDSALIVGDSGLVVPPGDSEALSGALQRLITMGKVGRSQLGALSRKRIVENYSLDRIVDRYETLYQSILEPDR